MRLTLRTLLAYLDDTLEPAQAKAIGQKIAESEQARDIINLIQQVTRRRRITTAPDSGPGGKLDPNTLGEYLDNVLPPEQAAEVEEICLASDTHLAEVASCHQVLTLILGEIALAPPSANQRMYALVKGPEAIPFRKPAARVVKTDHEVPEGHDVDDTLRLGLAPVTGKNKGNPLLLIGAAAAAACLLVVAVWQILKERSERAPTPAPINFPVAQVDPKKDKAPPVPETKDKVNEVKEEKKEPVEAKKDDQKDLPEVKLPPVVADVPAAAANRVVQAVGKLAVDPKDPAILLQYSADKTEWRRIGAKNPDVVSGKLLVSLPASKSMIELDKGVKLTLAGGIYPEAFYSFPLYESRVELHATEQFELDLTLDRGRIRIVASERPARIRLRFENPTQPSQRDFFDITLRSAGTEVLVDRWFYSPAEKFFRNAEDANRTGPTAAMSCVVLSGSILLRANDVTAQLSAPPGPALIFWSSRKGLDQPVSLKELPDVLVKSLQPIAPNMDARLRTDLLRARDGMHQSLLTKAIDVATAEGLKSTDFTTRLYAIHCLGAVDDVAALLEQLENESVQEVRKAAIEVLRHWQASSRDHDYKLMDQLKTKYRNTEAENIVTLLHDYSAKDLMNPDTYDLLITYLDHPQLALRELASWHLYARVPAGQKIRYNASADPATRRQGQTAWRTLIPVGQLPPMMKQQ